MEVVQDGDVEDPEHTSSLGHTESTVTYRIVLSEKKQKQKQFSKN